MAAGHATTYREFNFSPSGEWAAYAFRDYRDRDTAWRPPTPPQCQIRISEQSLELEAYLPGALLPDTDPARLRLGLSAVVEDANGVLSYWALAHPVGKPDFHWRGAFSLQLSDPDDSTAS